MASLAHRLGLRAGLRICLLDEPATPATAALREALPPDLEPDQALAGASYDLIFFWPVTSEGLGARFAALQAWLAPAGALWAVLPKRAVARRRGIALTWDALQSAALTTDLVDNKIASLGDQEYATRFVIRTQARRVSRP